MVPCGLAVILGSVLARAAPAPEADVAAAAEAFSHAQRAELAHEYARAAEFYELADGLAPTPEALRSAAKNRFAADQLAMAATRAEALLRRYPESERSVALAQRILSKAKKQLAAVAATCSRPCVIASDHAAVSTERALSHTFYLEPGEHEVVASFGADARDTESVRAAAGESVSVEFDAPPTTQPPPGPENGLASTAGPATRPRRTARLHPAFFAVGAVATVGLGATTIWSGADVLAQHSAYAAAPTAAAYDKGLLAQRRTNILIGVTAAVGVATVLFAVFTNWSRGTSKRTQDVGLSPGGLSLRF